MNVWYAVLAAVILLTAAGTAAAQPVRWDAAGMGGGGALFLPSFNPHDAAELYLSCDMSQVFHSTDFGASWSVPSFTHIGGGNVTGRVEFTGDPSIRYAISRNGDGAQPRRSTDGGATWTPLAGNPTGQEAFFLVADPSRSDRILLTDYTHLYLSTDGGTTFSARDTIDEGYYIAGALFDGETIYLGTSAGIRVSADGGATWSTLPVGGIPSSEAMVSFAGAKDGGTLRFFAVTLGSGDVYPGVTGADHELFRGVYTLTSGQSAWTKRAGIPDGVHPFFVSTARNDADVAYVAGGGDGDAPTVYKTTDGGATWRNVLRTANNENVATGWSGDGGDRGWSYGEYALGFTVDPANPDRAMITDLGFVHLTTDGGTSWRQIYLRAEGTNPAGGRTPRGRAYRSSGLENTSCWSLAWADSSTIFASYSDIRGALSRDGGASWSQGYSGHTMNTMYHVVAHPTTGVLYGATSSVHDMYQSTRLSDDILNNGQGEVLYSSDKGATWSVLHDFHHPVIWLALDPTSPNRLYASVIHGTEGGIYVSGNIELGGASTWTRLAAPPRTEGHPFNVHAMKEGSLLASYSGRRTGAGFTASSGVFLSTDGGATWLDRSAPQMHYWTKDVVIDPHDASGSTWYAGVFSGWGGAPNGLGGLYRTTDRGVSWSRILDLDRVTSCTIAPDDPDEMYVTTEVDGLWHTADLRASTPAFTLVESYPFRQPERVFFDPYHAGVVWVTSFGNGIRRGSVDEEPALITPMATDAAETDALSVRSLPGRAGGDVAFLLTSRLRRERAELRIVDMAGRVVATPFSGSFEDGTREIRWSPRSLSAGIYWYELRAGSARATGSIRIVR